MNRSFRDASPFHGFLGQPQTPEQLKAIVETAVLAEREACAKVCEDHTSMAEAKGYTTKGETFIDGWGDGSCACAAAIRARGNDAG